CIRRGGPQLRRISFCRPSEAADTRAVNRGSAPSDGQFDVNLAFLFFLTSVQPRFSEFSHDLAAHEDKVGVGISSWKGTNKRDAAVRKGVKEDFCCLVETIQKLAFRCMAEDESGGATGMLELEQGDRFEQLQVGTFALGVVSVADGLLQSL
ncbi:unnamed protein product, partial [Cyprideis torosa]